MLARWYADLMNYFWLPCPVCGENFGGFECGDEALMETRSKGWCVCSKAACVAAAVASRQAHGVYTMPEYAANIGKR